MKHQALAKRHADNRTEKQRNGGQSIIYSLQKTITNKKKSFAQDIQERNADLSSVEEKKSFKLFVTSLCREMIFSPKSELKLSILGR